MAAIESKTRPGRGACSCLRPLSGEWKATMGCKMVILWWYYGDTLKTKTKLYIYIYLLYIFTVYVKWYFYLQKCGCWPSMIGTNPCSPSVFLWIGPPENPSVKTGLPRPRGIRWTGGEGEWKQRTRCNYLGRTRGQWILCINKYCICTYTCIDDVYIYNPAVYSIVVYCFS